MCYNLDGGMKSELLSATKTALAFNIPRAVSYEKYASQLTCNPQEHCTLDFELEFLRGILSVHIRFHATQVLYDMNVNDD